MVFSTRKCEKNLNRVRFPDEAIWGEAKDAAVRSILSAAARNARCNVEDRVTRGAKTPDTRNRTRDHSISALPTVERSAN